MPLRRLAARGCERAMRSIDGAQRNLRGGIPASRILNYSTDCKFDGTELSHRQSVVADYKSASDRTKEPNPTELRTDRTGRTRQRRVLSPEKHVIA